MAKAAPLGPPMMRSALRCRSSITCRIAESDYRNLDRVYIPLDTLADTGQLGAKRSVPSEPRRHCSHASASSPAVPAISCISSRPFSASIDDTRLALEVAVIQTLAERLVGLLSRRDPLSERVHLGKTEVAGFGLLGLLWGATRRVGRVLAAGHKPQDA